MQNCKSCGQIVPEGGVSCPVCLSPVNESDEELARSIRNAAIYRQAATGQVVFGIGWMLVVSTIWAFLLALTDSGIVVLASNIIGFILTFVSSVVLRNSLRIVMPGWLALGVASITFVIIVGIIRTIIFDLFNMLF